MLLRPLFSSGIVACAMLLAALLLTTGYSLDKHQSLYSQMLDCEQRYANLLAKATDVESVKQMRPQMKAEAKKYGELGEQFLNVEGLTPEKLKGIIERSADRQKAINAKIKEQMDRLTANSTDNQMRIAIPDLDWNEVKMNFIWDSELIARGKKRQKEQFKDDMDAARARMQKSRDEMKARMEASRTRFEEMRSKMRRPDSAPAGPP